MEVAPWYPMEGTPGYVLDGGHSLVSDGGHSPKYCPVSRGNDVEGYTALLIKEEVGPSID